MTTKTFLAGVTMLAALESPAYAGILDDVFDDYGTCYARQYDAQHLSSHPRQKVSVVYLSHTAEPDPGYNGVLLDFGFIMRDGDLYSANVYCDRNDRCSVEGDGGNFRVSETKDGLRIEVGDFLGIEGANGWSGDLTESDDRVFLVYRESPRACSYE